MKHPRVPTQDDRPGGPSVDRGLRLVIAHDFAETYGGAERVLAHVASMYPEAPVYAILGRRSVARRIGVEDRFHTLLPPRRRLLHSYRALAPIFPALVRAARLPPADVLFTSSYAFSHGFATQNRAPQVCYCHSPLRFAWSMTDAYRLRMPGRITTSTVFGAFAALMRFFDRRAAGRVEKYLAASDFTADQIQTFYGREAEVVAAPVDCSLFRPATEGHDGYFLFSGRLVEAYKRPSAVVEAFRSLPHRLVIAGDGPALPALRSIAGPNVDFLGQLDDDALVPLMQRCAGAIFPSCDDLGLTPLEVMACGRPVLAFAGGGALRTVKPGVTGEFFPSQTAEAVEEAVRAFDPEAYDPQAIRSHAEAWDVVPFQRRIAAAIETIAPTA